MEEITRLKTENERLTRIIEILLDQIGILKAQNQAYFKGNTSPHLGSTIAGKVHASSNDGSTIAEKVDALSSDGSTIAEKVDALSSDGSTIAEKVDALSSVGSTIAGKGIHPIPVNTVSEVKLIKALEQYYPVSIKREALGRIAAQLLLLYNNHKASRKELFQISKLSKPGFAKAIPKLVRRGFVKKTGYQEYEISQLSKDIIAKTFPA